MRERAVAAGISGCVIVFIISGNTVVFLLQCFSLNFLFITIK